MESDALNGKACRKRRAFNLRNLNNRSEIFARHLLRGCFGILFEEPNWERGFGKASDRVEAKDHLPLGILGEVWWGALSIEGRKLDRCSKVIIGLPVSIPNALVKR